MNKSVVQIYQDDGTTKEYVRLSARLPEFLEKYPLGKEYRLTTDVTDLLSLQHGMLELYKIPLQNGKNPVDLGLPPLSDFVGVVVTRNLVDMNGNIVASASASGPVIQYKDYEKRETAALQRLVALLGFGGEVFDEDEAGDMLEQGLKTQSSAVVSIDSTKPVTVPAPEQGHETEEHVKSPDLPAPAEESTPEHTQEVVSEPSSTAKADREAAKKQKVSAAILRTVRNQAKLRGIPDEQIPEFADTAEARKYLVELNKPAQAQA